MILVRYGEMTLKKKNYKTFLNKINDNIKNKCSKFKKLKFINTDYRFYIYLNGEDYTKVLEELNTVVGLYSFSIVSLISFKVSLSLFFSFNSIASSLFIRNNI